MTNVRRIEKLNVTVSDRKPIPGDEMININPKSLNFGLTCNVYESTVEFLDLINWKVVVES